MTERGDPTNIEPDVVIENGRIDVVEQVRAGRGWFEWATITRKHAGYELEINVFADAMTFNGVPELDWAGRVIDRSKVYDFVRLPASAEQLQQIADHFDAMLMTPVVIEELWLQADIRIDAIVNDGPPQYKRVADLGITYLHQIIEKELRLAGHDGCSDDLLVSSVGKYWCLINGLGIWENRATFGQRTACNFGWCSSEGSGPGVTDRVRCWQRPGYRHPLTHHDPSQVIRLMSRHATLVHPDGTRQQVTLEEIAADPKRAPLIHHESGPLTVLRQPGVPRQPMGGTITLPEVTIEGTPPKATGAA